MILAINVTSSSGPLCDPKKLENYILFEDLYDFLRFGRRIVEEKFGVELSCYKDFKFLPCGKEPIKGLDLKDFVCVTTHTYISSVDIETFLDLNEEQTKEHMEKIIKDYKEYYKQQMQILKQAEADGESTMDYDGGDEG